MKLFGTSITEYLPAFGLLVLAIIYLITGYGYTPEARAFPVTVGWAVVVLVLLDLGSRTRTETGEALMLWLNPAALEKRDSHVSYPLFKQIAALLWLGLLVALMVLVGILAAVPLFTFASMRFRGKRQLWLCLAVAAGAGLFMWLLFVQLLALQLYPGILIGE